MAKSGRFLAHLWVLNKDTKDQASTDSIETCGASATVNGVGQEWKTRYYLKRVGPQNVLVAKTPQQNGRYEFSGEIPVSSDQPLDIFAQELKVKKNIRTPERPIYKLPAKESMGTWPIIWGHLIRRLHRLLHWWDSEIQQNGYKEGLSWAFRPSVMRESMLTASDNNCVITSTLHHRNQRSRIWSDVDAADDQGECTIWSCSLDSSSS